MDGCDGIGRCYVYYGVQNVFYVGNASGLYFR